MLERRLTDNALEKLAALSPKALRDALARVKDYAGKEILPEAADDIFNIQRDIDPNKVYRIRKMPKGDELISSDLILPGKAVSPLESPGLAVLKQNKGDRKIIRMAQIWEDATPAERKFLAETNFGSKVIREPGQRARAVRVNPEYDEALAREGLGRYVDDYSAAQEYVNPLKGSHADLETARFGQALEKAMLDAGASPSTRAGARQEIRDSVQGNFPAGGEKFPIAAYLKKRSISDIRGPLEPGGLGNVGYRLKTREPVIFDATTKV